MFKIWFGIPFWQRVLAGFILGALLGIFAPQAGVAVQPLGQLFINAIQMLVAPLIFFSIISSLTSMQDHSGLGRIAGKTIGLFLFTALLASIIGLTVGTLFDLSPATTIEAASYTEREVPPVSQVLLNIIPRNPFAALVEGNVLQIILFAALVGIALNQLRDKLPRAKNFFSAGAEVMFQITRYVLELTPIGVFALMAWVMGSYGPELLLPLAKFILAVFVACLVHIILVYGGLIKFVAGRNPMAFFRAVFPTQLIAFSTSSSYGTLPSTLRTTTEKLGVKKEYASFSLPLGATINMDGCGGIYPAIVAIFVAHLYGIELTAMQYLIIAGTATIASVGTAGVPGSAVVMLSVTLSAVGLPLEGIAFVAAIDRIVDMMRTTTNVTGDMAVSVAVASTEEGLLQDSIIENQDSSGAEKRADGNAVGQNS